jgi:hypothetical protein
MNKPDEVKEVKELEELFEKTELFNKKAKKGVSLMTIDRFPPQ